MSKLQRDYSHSLYTVVERIHMQANGTCGSVINSMANAYMEEMELQVNWLEHEVEIAWKDSSSKNEKFALSIEFDEAVRALCRAAIKEGKKYIEEKLEERKIKGLTLDAGSIREIKRNLGFVDDIIKINIDPKGFTKCFG